MVAHRESAGLAEQFIHETCARQGIERGQLTIHADRGPAMTSKPGALLLADLGVTKTHGRPHVSNDNSFWEAQFKTLKYRPAFPTRFGSIQDARAHCHVFFPWYNAEHHHSGLGLLTPRDVHHGMAEGRVAARATGLTAAYAAHPERFPPARPARRRVPWKCGSIHPRPERRTDETRRGGFGGFGGWGSLSPFRWPARTVEDGRMPDQAPAGLGGITVDRLVPLRHPGELDVGDEDRYL